MNGRPDTPALSPTLRAFMAGWQPRQRRTLGMLNALLTRLQAVSQAHPEWAAYDLLTHLLAALHLIIENDRLTGGHTEDQIMAELVPLVASEGPSDEPAVHRAIAEAVVDVLTNARNRRLRLRDRYLHAGSGFPDHREQSFSFVRSVGDDDSPDPTLRATPEAINVFQNLYQFDPSDRAAAERYRSQRMLDRQEYDEVLTSIDRRATAVHGLRRELEGLVRRIRYNVRDVNYGSDVIPHLDEVIDTVSEQVNAEERFAEAVADLTHHAAPDLARLQRISGSLRDLLAGLGELQSTGLTTKRAFEAEQDRQLFTYRRITINPQAQLLEPLLETPSTMVMAQLGGVLATWLGPRRPQVWHLGEFVARCTPGERPSPAPPGLDPFDLGESRGTDDHLTPVLLRAVVDLLGNIDRPTRLSALLAASSEHLVAGIGVREELEWAVAVTVAGAYGQTVVPTEGPHGGAGFDHARLGVVATGEGLPPDGSVVGDDPIVVPRRAPGDK